MSAIRIVRGEYRKNTVSDQVFSLVSGFQSGAKGNFVTVKTTAIFPTVQIRSVSVLTTFQISSILAA